MNSLILVVALSCGKPSLMNLTRFPWNKFDSETLVRATKRCGELYPNSPCLKVLFKTGKQDYKAICGKQNNESGPTIYLPL